MKIRVKVISSIIAFSVFTLLFFIVTFSSVYLKNQRDEIEKNTEQSLSYLSESIEHELHHYVNLGETVLSNTLIKETLRDSNVSFSMMSDEEVIAFIDSENNQWKNSTSSTDEIKKKYLQTELSSLLSEIVSNEIDYYGEIFITNKHGLVVGTSGELTTIAHSHKYWWQGAYNDADYKVYFDDRGYDLSVGKIVLGVVMPILIDDEFVGIIKINVKISDMLDEHIYLMNELTSTGEFYVIRQNGEIISKQGVEPLSTSVSEEVKVLLAEEFYIGEIITDGDDDFIGIMDISLDDMDEEAIFGGNSADAIDYKYGSSGGVWKVIYLSNTSLLTTTATSTIKLMLFIGTIFTALMITVGVGSTSNTVKQLKELQNQTDTLMDGEYSYQNNIKTRDEIGILANNLNDLSLTLKTTTTSIDVYETELEKSLSLQKELDRVSRIDELTGIFNRRGFNEYFKNYLATYKRTGNSIGFVIFDIDDFKNINDTYGHSFGDIVLSTIAKKVGESIRENDILCRWGGEEFVLLVSNASVESLIDFSEKVRSICANIEFSDNVRITVSCGGTTSKELDTQDTIISRADQLLYEAKNTGKNKSIIR